MRATTYLLAALAALPVALATGQQKSAIVWFDDPSTPDSVIAKAREDIIKAGGKITHDYTIIKGFAVIAPDSALQTVRAFGSDHSIQVEEDEIMSTNQ